MSLTACFWTPRHVSSTLDGKSVDVRFEPERAIVTIPGRIDNNQVLAIGPEIIAPHTDCKVDLDLHKEKGIRVGFTSSFTQVTYVLDCGPDSHPKPANAVF